jgi:UDP-N-acetylmuramate--alanine ligase
MTVLSRRIDGPAGTDAAAFAGQHVHLIGIGGCGMRGVAAVLLKQGAHVTGSDRVDSGITQRLAHAGAVVHIGQRAENLPQALNLVVVSAAVKDANPEVIEAKRRGCEIIKYAELVGRLMTAYTGLAVAGTHGKSTTTAMTAYILRQAGLDPSFIVGAVVDQLDGPAGVGAGEHLVVEACEFDRSFLQFTPTLAAILNIEEDHLDYYAGLDEIIESFAAFASRVPAHGLIVANHDDRSAMAAAKHVGANVETFGFGEGANWRATNLVADRGRFAFDWHHNDNLLGRVQMALAGRHNVANGLAAAAIAVHCGAAPDKVIAALGQFAGAKRRLTQRGQAKGITIVDDYAHHPTEIQATLRAARDLYTPKRLFVVFQPHQHSRTRFLLADFAKSFGLADVVVIPDIYFVRDSEAELDKIGSMDLVEKIHAHGGEALYLPEFAQIQQYLKDELRAGDVVVTMGAGDVWKVADELVEWLGIDL